MANPPDTQQKSVIPLCDVRRTASGSFQWHLEQNVDAGTPIFHYNNLQVHICGEDSFRHIAEDIQAAEVSIDIICWGFDPAMELLRKPGPWKRGVTWGDLLRDAAEGKLKSQKKVPVRVLSWRDELAVGLGSENMPGYKKDADYELKAAAGRGMASALTPRGDTRPLAEPSEPIDRREVFNAHWYRDVVEGRIEGLALRTRGGVHQDVLTSLKAEATAGVAPAGIERLGLEWLATHHQKTIVIDYEGSRPRAYVMGLNAVTDYWDTKEHVFNDTRRARNSEGDDKDHSVGKDWDHASSGQPTVKPYQDYVCRIEGEAVAAVYKNFVEAWNQAHAKDKRAGASIPGHVDLKAPPARLTRHLTAANSRAQILRTLPRQEGGERSIERLYYQAASNARHYLYIENQYFQNTDWARALKAARQAFVQGFANARPPLSMAQVPPLHVIVVTPTPERGQMVPRTHDTVAELGQGDSMPEQDKLIRQELEQQRQAEQEMADYNKRRAPYDERNEPYPLAPPRAAQPLSAVAQSYKDAGGERMAQASRELLASTLGMRTLVASLWTHDGAWSLANTAVAKKADEERLQYEKRMQEWERYQAARSQAKAASIQAGGWGSSMDTRVPPTPPPDRSTQFANATAQRYREIYIHSKLMLIDDSMFTLGSANLNLRSFAVDSEINIASDDPWVAKDLRQRVWAQHTKGLFDGGGEATDPNVMKETFANWEKEASDNLLNKKRGLSLSSFLVKFLDERTSQIRVG